MAAGVRRGSGPCGVRTSGYPHLVTGPQQARILVVMGVSGVGKSTIAKSLSTLLGWTFAEGDAFHPEANVAKMAAGTPLRDEDRWPWLRALGAWMSEEVAAQLARGVSWGMISANKVKKFNEAMQSGGSGPAAPQPGARPTP